MDRSLLLLAAVLGACNPAPSLELAPPPSSGEVPRQEILDVQFAEIHQSFLRRTLSTQTRSERWRRLYKGRWVRWTGKLAAISTSGLKFKHLQSTITFDTSVILNEPQRSQLRRVLTVGNFYTYMARLDRFDDLFKTIYFDQGVVLNPSPEGVAGQLEPTPPPLRRAPVEPRRPSREFAKPSTPLSNP